MGNNRYCRNPCTNRRGRGPSVLPARSLTRTLAAASLRSGSTPARTHDNRIFHQENDGKLNGRKMKISVLFFLGKVKHRDTCNPLLCCTTNAILHNVDSTNQSAPTHAFKYQAKECAENYVILRQPRCTNVN